MRDKKDLLRFCRYYKGEEVCPSNINAMFWGYERKWVEFSFSNSDILGSDLNEYLVAGLSEFDMQDDTPITLKALLFERYRHWIGGYGEANTISFKKWYNSEYKK